MARKSIAVLLFVSVVLILGAWDASDVPEFFHSPEGTVNGELKVWHRITLGFDGPDTSETADPNPFTDYRLDVLFTCGKSKYLVPGFYAADGNAANTGGDSGPVWLVHFSPDQAGTWKWKASFVKGKNVAQKGGGSPARFMHGKKGTFLVKESDKTGVDLRSKGRLQYVGKHHLRFAGSGEYFLKAGADAPENFLAYADFDGPFKSDGKKDKFIKTWQPHVKDWRSGDPTWSGGKGKGMIGAINYLAEEGMNVFSFLPMNIEGDDQNVFPYLNYEERLRMDVSRLAQWEVIFAHGTKKGMYLHFKTQETENDQLLDGGELGPQRKLYYRELVARFGHHLALNWNLGEENTNTHAQRVAFAAFFQEIDPYDHLVVVHSYPGNQRKMYQPLLGKRSLLGGASIQTGKENTFAETKRWVDASAAAGRPWVVASDEQNSANDGVVPDKLDPGHDVVRKEVLWGNIMAGGAGVEYYFGYKHPHSDLTCQDFRSRDLMWDQTRHALDFFRDHKIPFQEMKNDNTKINVKQGYCLLQPGKVYVVYLKHGGGVTLDLSGARGAFSVQWFNPRKGGALKTGKVKMVEGGGKRPLGNSPAEDGQDWVILVRKK